MSNAESREIGDRLVAILGGKVYGPYERAGRVKKVYLYMLRDERLSARRRS